MSKEPADDPFHDCGLGPDEVLGTRTFCDVLFTDDTETPVNVLTGETPAHSQPLFGMVTPPIACVLDATNESVGVDERHITDRCSCVVSSQPVSTGWVRCRSDVPPGLSKAPEYLHWVAMTQGQRPTMVLILCIQIHQ